MEYEAGVFVIEPTWKNLEQIPTLNLTIYVDCAMIMPCVVLIREYVFPQLLEKSDSMVDGGMSRPVLMLLKSVSNGLFESRAERDLVETGCLRADKGVFVLREGGWYLIRYPA